MGNRKPPTPTSPHPLPGIYGKKAIIRYFEKEEDRTRPGSRETRGELRNKMSFGRELQIHPRPTARNRAYGLLMDYLPAGSALHGPGDNTAA